jgi:hypothetical protein
LLSLCLYLPACKQPSDTVVKRQTDAVFKHPEKSLNPADDEMKAMRFTEEEIGFRRYPIPLWRSDTRHNLVIHNIAEWENAWKKTYASRDSFNPWGNSTPDRPPVGFDFEHFIILIAFYGPRVGAGENKIHSVTYTSDSVTVEVRDNKCAKWNMHIPEASYPGDAVVINKTDRKIIFKMTETGECPWLPYSRNMIRGYNDGPEQWQ